MHKNAYDINFGSRLNKLRKLAGYTQVELAMAWPS
jgi:DNA-binding XRE family transcriptional regulator